MLDVVKLYPQYRVAYERRQQNVPVENDRRSGVDRRSTDRVKLDTNLTRDIFEVKNKVSDLQKPKQKDAEKVNFTHNVTRAAQNSIKTDQFIKTTKPNSADNKTTFTKSSSNSNALAGVLGIILGGTLATTLLGPAGVGIAVGLGAYFGGKFLKTAIVSHMKNKL